MKKVTEFLTAPVGSTLFSGLLGGIALVLVLALGVETPSQRLALSMSLSAVVLAGLMFMVLRCSAGTNKMPRSRTGRDLPLAFFDTMTGIPNRFFFQDRISGVLSEGRDGAIFLIDLSHFDRVNDRRGRSFGDAIIKELAHRLRVKADAAHGLAARLGGDRFGLYLPDANPDDLDQLCTTLVEECRAPVTKGGEAAAPGVNMGVVSVADIGPLRALGYEAVISVCNFALATAKRSHDFDYQIYDAELEKQFLDLDSMANELPEALRSGDLEVFLQPRVQLDDSSLIGFEALVRWSRKGAYVPAEELVAMAEETGLIYNLDGYMVDRAIHAMADWNRRRKTAYPVSVNLSALHLRRESGVAFIAECLDRHNLAPELLTIEITETANLAKWQYFEGLTGLRDIGCRIAIDDFGTGYASLERLRILPANEIKIDRMLVAELIESEEARIILDAVLMLAERLGMDVVAEGIETDEQIALLYGMGCRFGQGFIFGKPRPALDWLADATYGPSEDAEYCGRANISRVTSASTVATRP